METKVPFYFLPVSPEERAAWLPEIPKKITNAGADAVSYQATGPGGSKQTKRGVACYSYLSRSRLNEYNIHCLPRRPSLLSLEDVQTFFVTMVQHHLVPEAIQLWEEKDGIHCQIPKQAGPVANIYVALTCYRWVDAHAPLVWEFLRILEQDIPRHPLQILPYLIHRHVSNSNHSFIATGGWKATLKEFEKATNPTLGLAAKIVFDPDDPRGEEVFTAPETHCNVTVGKVSRDISPQVQIENLEKRWGPNILDAPHYLLEQPEDGLHPDLYQLYTQPNITTEQIREILSNLFTKEMKELPTDDSSSE